MDDPMERIIEKALTDAGVTFTTDFGGGNAAALDFHLPQFGVYIEVKRFYSTRIAEQMSRANNIILAQGEDAVKFLASCLSGKEANARSEAAEARAAAAEAELAALMEERPAEWVSTEEHDKLHDDYVGMSDALNACHKEIAAEKAKREVAENVAEHMRLFLASMLGAARGLIVAEETKHLEAVIAALLKAAADRGDEPDLLVRDWDHERAARFAAEAERDHLAKELAAMKAERDAERPIRFALRIESCSCDNPMIRCDHLGCRCTICGLSEAIRIGTGERI